MTPSQSPDESANSQKLPPEPHKLQEQPAEGDCDMIERELRRQPDKDKPKRSPPRAARQDAVHCKLAAAAAWRIAACGVW